MDIKVDFSTKKFIENRLGLDFELLMKFELYCEARDKDLLLFSLRGGLACRGPLRSTQTEQYKYK